VPYSVDFKVRNKRIIVKDPNFLFIYVIKTYDISPRKA